MKFNGSDYEHTRDSERLSQQHLRVRTLMSDGVWRTLDQISEVTGDPPASVSAQLRHLRKSRFGAYLVEKRYVENGLFEYRVLPGFLA